MAFDCNGLAALIDSEQETPSSLKAFIAEYKKIVTESIEVNPQLLKEKIKEDATLLIPLPGYLPEEVKQEITKEMLLSMIENYKEDGFLGSFSILVPILVTASNLNEEDEAISKFLEFMKGRYTKGYLLLMSQNSMSEAIITKMFLRLYKQDREESEKSPILNELLINIERRRKFVLKHCKDGKIVDGKRF